MHALRALMSSAHIQIRWSPPCSSSTQRQSSKQEQDYPLCFSVFVLHGSLYNEHHVPIYSHSVYVHKHSQPDSSSHEALWFLTGLGAGRVGEDVS